MADIIIPSAPRTYARVDESGIVRELLTTAADITHLFVAAIRWIDTSGVSPVPAIGWTYNADLKAFTAPVITPITVLPAAQFLARFTAAEMELVASAVVASPTLMVWYFKLIPTSATVDVTAPAIKTALDALVTAGAITTDRETAILA